MPASTVDPCSILIGPSHNACEDARHLASGAANAASVATDPAGSLAKACAQAAGWVLDKLAVAVDQFTQVDFSNAGFLKQYAIVFGASTFLTVILWLLAVAKRAAHGVALGQALGEAVGFLWMAVAASAFTPLMLAVVVSLTDDLTRVLAGGSSAATTTFLTGLGKSLPQWASHPGPVLLVVVSLLATLAAVVIWVELLLRAAMLYVGAVLGCAVYSGLVDRSMWRHVRRWAGIMVAVDLSKPVLVIVLSLAAAITSANGPADAYSSVLSGLAILFLSIFASFAIYRFVPSFGDDMAQAHYNRRQAQNSGPAAAVDGPASYVRSGIATHGHRSTSGGTSGSTTKASAGAVSALAAPPALIAAVAAQSAKAAVKVPTQRAEQVASRGPGSAGKPS